MTISIEELIGTLERHGITCWVDSGSLLGLVREGSLLPHDRDIDLGIWISETKSLRGVAQELREKRFRIVERCYNGELVEFKAYPPGHWWRRVVRWLFGHEGRIGRLIDVKVFRRTGALAWCPAIHVRQDLPKAVRYMLEYLIDDVLTALDVPRSRVARLLDVGTWIVPATHFEALDEIGDGLPIPTDAHEYLRYRYGDWRQPRPDWFYLRDDRSLWHAPPEETITGQRAPEGDSHNPP